MREILFRGKRTDNGEWVEGAFCPKDCDMPFGPMVDKSSIIKLDDPCSGFWFEVDPDTVCQFTGLLDKNGKRIFDGDVLRWVGPDGEVGKVYVVFAGGVFALQSVECPLADPDLFADFEIGEQTLEVIGNIHDNPELMGGGADD